LASDISYGIIISTSGFTLQVYKVNFCKLEKRVCHFTAADVVVYETWT